MNVLFIFTWYAPGEEKLNQLWELQQFLSNARWGLENRVKKLHPYQAMIERQKHHSYLRSKIRIVPEHN